MLPSPNVKICLQNSVQEPVTIWAVNPSSIQRLRRPIHRKFTSAATAVGTATSNLVGIRDEIPVIPALKLGRLVNADPPGRFGPPSERPCSMEYPGPATVTMEQPSSSSGRRSVTYRPSASAFPGCVTTSAPIPSSGPLSTPGAVRVDARTLLLALGTASGSSGPRGDVTRSFVR